MMSDALHDRIRNFVLENFLFSDDKDLLGLDDSLLGKGIVDSTGMLEVILFIEEEFAVKVADSDMVPENLDSVNRIASYIASRRKAG